MSSLLQRELARRVNLGNRKLTALWKHNPENLEVCR
jgi:hypothetical protein